MTLPDVGMSVPQAVDPRVDVSSPLPFDKRGYRNILVLGGTGFVGRALLDRLVERSGGANQRIVVPTRHRGHGRAIQMLPTVDLVDANVHDDATLAQLVRQSDAVVNLIAILHGNDAAFRRVNTELPMRLARIFGSVGTRRLVHVSALGASESAPSAYLRSKAAGEAALTAAHLPLSVLRPSVIFGRDDRFLNTFASLQAVFPLMPLASSDARFQPVWVDDVAMAIVRCLEDDATLGATYECTGPDVYTLAQLVQMAGRWSGNPRRVWALPAALGRLQATLLEWLPGEPL
ncbi:MAG: putative NADH-ubiquinone oxidoreductase, partial [Rhizobacter sp.]|nr:putative NADH-ubiquinone oxidoreductase [Rhizobacter sp.]